VDNSGAKGFKSVADAYERARPSWPPAAIDSAFHHWGLDPAEGLVVDVAAGTGRLTKLLAERCPRVLAVEPLVEMRRHIRDAPAVKGSAERLRIDDAAAQAIFVGEAFHWFDRPAALAEFARVLAPGGGLALMWNTPRSDVTHWQEAVGKLFADLPANSGQRMPPGIGSTAANYRDPTAVEWRTGPEWEAFEPIEHFEYGHAQTLDRAGVVALIGSWSFVGSLDASARAELLARVEQMLAKDGIDSVELSWRCDLYLTRRR
jgi:SAM-dependent methyltransferase